MLAHGKSLGLQVPLAAPALTHQTQESRIVPGAPGARTDGVGRVRFSSVAIAKKAVLGVHDLLHLDWGSKTLHSDFVFE